MPGFDQAADRALSAEELHTALTAIAQDPLAGDLLKGTGGVRKLRVKGDGRGKSGGARVIYYFYDSENPIYLLTVFAKKEKDNLSEAERNALKKLTAELKAALRAGPRS